MILFKTDSPCVRHLNENVSADEIVTFMITQPSPTDDTTTIRPGGINIAIELNENHSQFRAGQQAVVRHNHRLNLQSSGVT
jgi:hypothetical protein